MKNVLRNNVHPLSGKPTYAFRIASMIKCIVPQGDHRIVMICPICKKDCGFNYMRSLADQEDLETTNAYAMRISHTDAGRSANFIAVCPSCVHQHLQGCKDAMSESGVMARGMKDMGMSENVAFVMNRPAEKIVSMSEMSDIIRYA